MDYSANSVLDSLINSTPRPTAHAPQNARGIYGLVDHLGVLSYIGSTCATDETLHKRIHRRHRTGSENSSHYYSRMYNTGRMWRDRDDDLTKNDGLIAKELRNEFISDHCRAVWVTIPDNLDIMALERSILAMAPSAMVAWNGRKTEVYEEPAELVDETLHRLAWGSQKLEAIERQRLRHRTRSITIASSAILSVSRHSITPLPHGEFRFVALDVETANNDRGSICQVGLAFVRPDNTIETWMTYVDPKTNDWSCSRIHGITSRTVRGAPTFSEVFDNIDRALNGVIVYQHSGFDQSAITAACSRLGIQPPNWAWRDSVQIARSAWPELKGNGGHGLASLKAHLSLQFDHHDAGEDARAAAQVVLLAEDLNGKTTDLIKTHSKTVAARFEQAGLPPSPPSTAAVIRTFETHVTGKDSPHMSGRQNPKNPTRDALLAKIAGRSDIHPHSSQRSANGTKYISAFTLNGRIFAVDKTNACAQPIWVLDREDVRAFLDAQQMRYDEYPPHKTRNHNLHKLPNFKDGALLRIYPKTVEEGMAIIEGLRSDHNCQHPINTGG